MAGGKQTPRQRMMGILYLVLLGLVALSIPDSLLDAFKNIKLSLDSSTKSVGEGIDATYANFEATKLKEQHDRALPIYNRAKDASKTAKELFVYVDSLKAQLIRVGGGMNETTHDVDARENLDISPRIMITDKKAEELKTKILETREKLVNDLNPKDRAGVNFSLNAIDPDRIAGVKKTWEDAYFGEGIPLGATLTTLAKIQVDTKSAENEVVKKILGEAEKATVNLDKFDAVAVAPTSYVLVGQPYTAEVFLTAYDSKLPQNITVGGSALTVEAGKGKYSGSTSSEGLKKWTATISFKDNDGKIQTYTTPEQSYMVARPSAVVSPTKMNVLYIGVPNPIAVSAPGIAKEKLHVTMSSGTLTGNNGDYTATVEATGTTTITVSGELAPGKTGVLGSTTFRIKRIPDPKAQFAGKSGGSTSAANLKAQDRLFAKLDNFDFDTKFEVVRFSMWIARPRQDPIQLSSNGGELTAQMKSALAQITPGTRVIFSNILATGPGGQRGLDDIVLAAN